jgi:nucleoside-diphosphate-sugar epimerase
MKWIITGGAGFIGCHAASRLREAGHQVVVADNLSRRGAESNLNWLREHGDLDFVKADVRDADAMHELIGRHADGEVFNAGGGPENTLSLLELVARLESRFERKLDPTFAGWRPGDQRVFVADIRKAERRLGWRPKVATAEGIDTLISWVKENRFLFQ